MTRLWRWWSFRRLVITALIFGIAVSVLTAAATWRVHSAAAGHSYTVDSVPAAPVVMVLGAQVDRDGDPSPFLAARLELARQIYQAGKADAVLVSGDHGQVEYNEVDPMRQWLIDAGVPASAVVGDYAGFDTWDSCVRAKEIFGVSELIVVTQSFHLDRSIAACREVGIDTVGVGDETVRRYTFAWKRGAVRDYGANVKAMWDMAWGTEPTFLGPYETSLDTAVAGR